MLTGITSLTGGGQPPGTLSRKGGVVRRSNSALLGWGRVWGWLEEQGQVSGVVPRRSERRAANTAREQKALAQGLLREAQDRVAQHVQRLIEDRGAMVLGEKVGWNKLSDAEQKELIKRATKDSLYQSTYGSFDDLQRSEAPVGPILGSPAPSEDSFDTMPEDSDKEDGAFFQSPNMSAMPPFPELSWEDVDLSEGHKQAIQVFGSVAEVDTHVAQMKAALVAGAIVLEFSPQRLPGQREGRRGNHARRVRRCDGARSRLHCTWCRTDTYGDRRRPRGSLVRAAIRLALHAPIAPRYLRTTVRSIWRHPLYE